MFSYITSSIFELTNLMVSSNTRYRIDLEYNLDNWIDKKLLLSMYNFNVEYFTEELSRSRDGIITTKRYDDYTTSEVANRVNKITNKVYDINVILRTYTNVVNKYTYIPYKQRTCVSYTYNYDGIVLEVKDMEDDIKLSIHIYNFNSIHILEALLLRISKTLYNSTCIISSKVYRVLKDYMSYTSFVMPKSITKDNIYKLLGPYIITKKLDGCRRYICMTMYGIYSIDRSDVIYNVSDTVCTYWQQSMLDCEFYNGVYYIIDAVTVKGKNVKNVHFNARREAASSLHKLLPDNVVNKSFYTCDTYTFFEIIRSVTTSDKYDGIILFRSDSNYNTQPIKIKKNNTCDLLYDGKHVVSSDNKKYGTCINWLITGVIYECVKVDNKWLPIKPRYDKVVANSSKTVKSCNISCTIYDILSCSPRCISIYTDQIKGIILDTHKDCGILLDIGSGYGTDVSKWLKYSHVYIIESNKSKLDILVSKLNRNHISNYTIINHELRMTQTIIDIINRKVDSVTCFFSYMSLSDEDIESMYDIISKVSSDICTIDIITTDKELVSKNSDNKHITLIDDDKVHIRIPHTLINHDERLVDTKSIETRMIDMGFSIYLISNIKPMFAIKGYQRNIISTFKYLGFNKGEIRRINIPRDFRKRSVYTVDDSRLTISTRKSRYNIVRDEVEYIIEDFKMINLF